MEVNEELLMFGRTIHLSSDERDDYLKTIIEVSKGPKLPEQDIISLILAASKENSYLVDVGANIGYISTAMSLIAEKGKVFSFEPTPRIFSYLKTNVKQNKLKNVNPYNIGLSDKSYKTKISYGPEAPYGAFISTDYRLFADDVIYEDIQLEKLDSIHSKLGITRCDVLKVDIEGHELKFLEGARKFISKFRPVTIIEANPYCLNIFNRISLPDFVDKVYKNFPYIFAFDEGRLLDLNESKSRSQFYFENTVKYKYQNIICGFDRVELLRIINSAFTDPMNRTTLQINNLVRKNDELTKQNLEILEKYEKIQSSNSHKIAIKVNKLLKR